MKFINKNKVFIISFIIPFITSLTGLFLFNLFPYNNSIPDIFSSTGNDSYITNYYMLYDHIHHIYSASEIKDLWAFYMTDPSNLIVLIFPRTMLICVLSILFSIKLGLTGLFFSIFLNYRYKKASNTNKGVIAIFLSTAYALSSYMLVYGTKISYLSVIALLPLIILSLEKLFYEKNIIPYYVMLSISFILNFYATGIVFIFTILYLITFKYSRKKEILNTILYKTAADILSIGTASFIIVPALKSTEATSFFQKAPPYNASIINFLDAFHQMFILSKPSSSYELSYGVDLYVGLLCLLLVIIYAVNPKTDILVKIKKLGVLAILFSGALLSGPNSLFNFFKDSKINSCFFLFTLIFFLISIASEVLINLETINKKSIANGSLICFALIIQSMILSNNYESSSPFIYSIELVVLYGILLFLICSKIKNSDYIILVTVLLGIVEVVFSFIWGMNTINYSSKLYTSSNTNIQYELEKNAPNASILEYDLYDDYFNPVLNVINKINYVTYNSADSVPDTNLEFDYASNGINIYKNNYSKNDFIYTDSSILDWTYSKSNTYSSMNYLASKISGNNVKIYSLVDSTPVVLKSSEITNKNYQQTTLQIDFSTEGDIYSNLTRPEYLGKYTENNPIIKNYIIYKYKELFNHQKSSYFYNFNHEDYDIFNNNIPYIESKDTISKDGYIINSINDSPLYDIYIDGKYISPIAVDECLWIVPISAGTHSIERTCHSSHINYIPYIFITLLSILCAITIKKIKDNKVLRTVYNKSSSFISNYYVYITTIVVSTIIVMLASYFNSCVPFGNLSALSGDGYAQTYPAIQSSINTLSIKDYFPSTIGFGTFIFSCGADPISSFIGTTISLFYRLLIHTNDGKLYAAVMATIYMLYSGPALIFYLTHRYSGKRFDKKNPYLILIALLYTFSSYSIGYYIFNNFIYGLYTPIIIYALERLIYKRKPLLYIIFLSFIMIRGYYGAFLLCEFIALYFLTLEHTDIKVFLKNTLHFILSSLLAAGLGAFNLLPSFLSMLNSPYRESDTLTSESVSDGINLFSTVFKTTSQYQVGVTPIHISSDNGGVNIYAGLLPLLFIAIYALNNHIKLSIRIRKLALCFLLFWAFGDSIFNFIFHGFHHQSNVPNRFSIFFIFMIITMMCDCIENISELSYKRLTYAITAISIALIAIWLIYPEKNVSTLALSIIFTVSYLVTVSIGYIKNLEKKQLIKILSYISVIELIISSFIGFSHIIGYTNKILEDNVKSISVLKSHLDDSNHNIYISENISNSADNYNMGLINGLNTISGFNSGLNTQVSSLAAFWGLNTSTNSVKYLTGNPLADMMMHVKYQFVNENDPEYGNSSIYELIAEQNNMKLYKNQYFVPVAFLTNSNVKNWEESDIESYYSLLDYHNGFSQVVCGKDLYTEITPSEDDKETNLETTLKDSTILRGKDLVVDISLNKKYDGKIYLFYGTRVAYVGNTEDSENNKFHVTLHEFMVEGDDVDMGLNLGILNEDVLSEMCNIFNESSIYDINKTKTSFSGKINVSSDGILYVSLPNYSNMKIYIDDKETPHFDYLMATGVNISEGSHTIKIVGDIGNYMNGVIISVISLLIILLYAILVKKINTKKDNSQTKENNVEPKNDNNRKQKINKDKKKLTINKTYILSFILPLIVLFSSIVYSGFSPFGPRDVLTGNDQSDYLKWYFELYDRVHSGQSILGYSTYTGTGYDFSSVLTYYLSDPTNLLILLFPRTVILSVLNILYVIKASLSGLFMSIYLANTNISFLHNDKKKELNKQETKENKKEKKDIIIGGSDAGPKIIKYLIDNINLPIVSMSLIYAISNYMLGPGFNVAIVGSVMMLPLIILGLERLVYENKKKLYIITYTLSFLFNYKITIITSLFMLLYLPLLHFEDIKSFIKVSIKKIGCDVIVFLLAAVVIINNITCTFWKDELVLPEKPEVQAKIFDVIKMLTTGIKPANLLLSGNNLYIYCGIITLLFLFFYIFNNNIKLIYRIKYSILYIILFIGFMIPSINSILNGFSYHDGLISTYAYIFIFLSICITNIEYNYLKDTKTIRVIIPAFFTTCLIVASLFLCKSYDDPKYFIKSLEFIFVYSIITMIYSNKSLAKWLLTLSISLTLIIELSCSFIPNMKTLSWLTYPYTNLETYKKDTSNKYIRKTFGESSILVYKPETSTHTPLEMTLMGYDYIYWVGEESKVYPTLEYAGEYEGLKIFKSKSEYNSYFIDDNIKNYKYDKYSIIDSTNDLSNNYLNGTTILIPIDFELVGGNYANGTNYIYVKPSEGGDLYFNYSYISNVNGTDGENNVQFIQYVNKNRTKYHKGLYKFSLDNYNETINNLTGYSIDINKTNTITADKKGYITMGLQNRLGWNIKVNGKKSSTLSFMNDGMLIPVEAGENTISFSFTPLLFYIGLIVSLITLIIVILFTRKPSCKREEKKSSNK